jgi:cell division protein FtsN
MSRLRDIIRREPGAEPEAPSGTAIPVADPVTMQKEASIDGKERLAHPLAYETAVADPRGKLPWLESTDNFDDDVDLDQPLIPRKWMLLGGLAFLALLIGVAFTIYKRVGQPSNAGPAVYADGSAAADDPRIPLIEAPKTPIRSEPLDAQGMKIEDQDKTIYDVADGQVVEGPSQMAEAPEQAIARAMTPKSKDAAKIEPGLTPVPPLDAPAVSAPVAVVTELKPEKPKPAPKPVAEKPKTEPKPEPKPNPYIPPAMASVPESSGSVYLQLGAFSTQERAEAAWSQISGKSGLSGLSSNIKEAGGSFKLRAGPVGSTAEAKSACAKLTAAGQGCFIAK